MNDIDGHTDALRAAVEGNAESVQSIYQIGIKLGKRIGAKAALRQASDTCQAIAAFYATADKPATAFDCAVAISALKSEDIAKINLVELAEIP